MVSIVTTCYNVSSYIAETINSILNQSYTDFELIIVDDCSTDNSMDIVRQFNDERIRIVSHSSNQGAGQARKTGIEFANGDYICLIDGDDTISKDYLKILVETAVDTNADIVAAKVESSKYRPIYHMNDKVYSTLNEKYYFYKDEPIKFINNKLIKKDLWNLVPYCTRRFLEDGPTYIKLLYYARKITVTPIQSDCIYYYRTREDSLINAANGAKTLLFTALFFIDGYEFLMDKEESNFNRLFKIAEVEKHIRIALKKRKDNSLYVDEYNTIINYQQILKEKSL